MTVSQQKEWYWRILVWKHPNLPRGVKKKWKISSMIFWNNFAKRVVLVRAASNASCSTPDLEQINSFTPFEQWATYLTPFYYFKLTSRHSTQAQCGGLKFLFFTWNSILLSHLPKSSGRVKRKEGFAEIRLERCRPLSTWSPSHRHPYFLSYTSFFHK